MTEQELLDEMKLDDISKQLTHGVVTIHRDEDDEKKREVEMEDAE